MSNIMITDVKEIQEFFQQYGFGDTFDMCCGSLSKIDESEDVSTKSLNISDIEIVLAYDEGENDGENWIFIFKAYDGRYAFMSAGCDYTGFDCRAFFSGSNISYSLSNLINFGLDDNERSRLNADSLLIYLEKEKLEEVVKESSKSSIPMKI
jgi:hypothetical protein